MPVYEYRCPECLEITDVVARVGEAEREVPCAHCGGTAVRILSRTSVHRDNASKLARLDPRYDKMVDTAMAGTGSADPDRLLKKMKPFSDNG